MASVEDWNPRLLNASTSKILYLPLPVLTFQTDLKYKNEQHSVPLRQYTDIYGTSRDGYSITVGGNCQANGYTKTPLCGEEPQFQTIAAVYAFLFGVPEAGFTLYPYDDASIAFKKCYPIGFNYGFGDQTRSEFPYSIQFACGDTNFYLNGATLTSAYTPTSTTAVGMIRNS